MPLIDVLEREAGRLDGGAGELVVARSVARDELERVPVFSNRPSGKGVKVRVVVGNVVKGAIVSTDSLGCEHGECGMLRVDVPQSTGIHRDLALHSTNKVANAGARRSTGGRTEAGVTNLVA